MVNLPVIGKHLNNILLLLINSLLTFFGLYIASLSLAGAQFILCRRIWSDGRGGMLFHFIHHSSLIFPASGGGGTCLKNSI
jgi:hypothetical protein